MLVMEMAQYHRQMVVTTAPFVNIPATLSRHRRLDTNHTALRHHLRWRKATVHRHRLLLFSAVNMHLQCLFILLITTTRDRILSKFRWSNLLFSRDLLLFSCRWFSYLFLWSEEIQPHKPLFCILLFHSNLYTMDQVMKLYGFIWFLYWEFNLLECWNST